jgi:hypothetical protein
VICLGLAKADYPKRASLKPSEDMGIKVALDIKIWAESKKDN